MMVWNVQGIQQAVVLNSLKPFDYSKIIKKKNTETRICTLVYVFVYTSMSVHNAVEAHSSYVSAAYKCVLG